MKIQNQKPERVFLIGADLKQEGEISVQETMEELAELAVTAGATVVGEGTQKMKRPHVATQRGSINASSKENFWSRTRDRGNRNRDRNKRQGNCHGSSSRGKLQVTWNRGRRISSRSEV